jgi:AcrR family transcriptional regulator
MDARGEAQASDPPARPPRARGAKLDVILGAALESFAELGFAGASMRTIAGRAGTSLSNLYNYFPSKDDLLVAVLKDANDELLTRVTEAVNAATATPEHRLRAAVRAYVGFSTDHMLASVVAISEFRYLEGDLRQDVVAARDSTQQIFVDLVSDGVRTGAFATPHAREAARAILLLCATVSTWYQPDGALTPDGLADQQADFAVALVRGEDAADGPAS